MSSIANIKDDLLWLDIKDACLAPARAGREVTGQQLVTAVILNGT